jgi:hypothetical protein
MCMFASKVYQKRSHINNISPVLSLLLWVIIITGASACNTIGSNCGNEYHSVSTRRVKPGFSSCGNEMHTYQNKKPTLQLMRKKERHAAQWKPKS